MAENSKKKVENRKGVLNGHMARSWDWYDNIWKTVGKCVFCDLRDRYVVYEKNGMVLTINLYPYTNAHLLIVPRRHIEYVKELTPEEWETLRGLMYVAKKVLRKLFDVKNIWFIYREGALGQAQKTVGHLHVQVIPYSDGLVTVNYKDITIEPGEVSTRLKKHKGWMDKKYDKYTLKYGKYSATEKRIVVTAGITNKKGEVLIVKKKHSLENVWELPGGSVEGEESLLTALTREVKEETGIVIKNMKFITIDEQTKDILFPEGFVKKWKLIFLCYKAEYLSGRLLAGDDVKEVRWVQPGNIGRYKLSSVTKKILKDYVR